VVVAHRNQWLLWQGDTNVFSATFTNVYTKLTQPFSVLSVSFYMTLVTLKRIFLYVKEVPASLMINFPHMARAKQTRPHLILSDIYYYSPSCWQSCRTWYDAKANCCRSYNICRRVLGLWFHWKSPISIIFSIGSFCYPCFQSAITGCLKEKILTLNCIFHN